MAEGRDRHDRPVAEQVEFAVDPLHQMAVIVVDRIVVVGLDQLRNPARLPFGLLHDDARIGDETVAAGMVEMQVGIDDVTNAARIDVARPGAHVEGGG